MEKRSLDLQFLKHPILSFPTSVAPIKPLIFGVLFYKLRIILFLLLPIPEVRKNVAICIGQHYKVDIAQTSGVYLKVYHPLTRIAFSFS